MRCIFCQRPSAGSRSIEHIVPESLGNTLYTLPAGIVCDACNNYSARKVEAPFLNSGAVQSLRAMQAVPKKNGRLVGLDGALLPGHQATVYFPSGRMPILYVPSGDALRELIGGSVTDFVFPTRPGPPDDHVTSRMLAKMALEALAHKGIESNLSMDFLHDHQFDPLRRHAKIGTPSEKWPHSIRRIYDSNTGRVEPTGEIIQRVHEFIILWTEHSEMFFVVALFGLEFAINMGEPDISGYERWLRQNNGGSPLYHGGNGNHDQVVVVPERAQEESRDVLVVAPTGPGAGNETEISVVAVATVKR